MCVVQVCVAVCGCGSIREGDKTMKVVIPEIWDGFKMLDELERIACLETQRFLGWNLPENWKGGTLDLQAKIGDCMERMKP